MATLIKPYVANLSTSDLKLSSFLMTLGLFSHPKGTYKRKRMENIGADRMHARLLKSFNRPATSSRCNMRSPYLLH